MGRISMRGSARHERPVYAAPRTFRIMNSYTAIADHDGQAALMCPVAAGSATVTSATRFAGLPLTSSGHKRNPV